jgi:hypothetical protein
MANQLIGHKKLQLCGSQNLFKGIVCGIKNEKAVLAYYEFALLISRNGPHTMGKI